jgi:hypothetical protein
MDRTLLEQECAEVFEESFQDFPLTHVFFHNLDRGKSVSVSKLWQELLTEFPIDKKCATFEILGRAIQSAQTMSVNTANEYTSYMCTRKSGPTRKRCLMKQVTMISPSTISARKISGFLNCKENLLSSTRSRPILPKRCRIVLVKPVHCANFDSTCRDIDPCVIHTSKASKTRALLTGVESGDYIDSEGNIVSVDNDFSLTAQVQGLVNQTLKIEMEKIETDAESHDKTKEKVAQVFITRFEREEREDD